MSTLKERRIIGSDPASIAALEETYKRGGLRAFDQMRLDAALERQRQGKPVAAQGLAGLYRNLDDYGRALDYLEKAYDERDPNMMVLKTFPLWKPMRDHPRFRALIAKVGLDK
jgi:tetratricopeptide (TPR) repeat protein